MAVDWVDPAKTLRRSFCGEGADVQVLQQQGQLSEPMNRTDCSGKILCPSVHTNYCTECNITIARIGIQHCVATV